MNTNMKLKLSEKTLLQIENMRQIKGGDTLSNHKVGSICEPPKMPLDVPCSIQKFTNLCK